MFSGPIIISLLGRETWMYSLSYFGQSVMRGDMWLTTSSASLRSPPACWGRTVFILLLYGHRVRISWCREVIWMKSYSCGCGVCCDGFVKQRKSTVIATLSFCLKLAFVFYLNIDQTNSLCLLRGADGSQVLPDHFSSSQGKNKCVFLFFF